MPAKGTQKKVLKADRLCRRRQVPFSDDDAQELALPDDDDDAGAPEQDAWSSFEVRAPDFGPQRSDVAL